MTDLFGNERIRTLGLYQPFATLMLHGKIETRWVGKNRITGHWKKPPFPLGKYLIYACQKQYKTTESHMLMGVDIFNHAKKIINKEPFLPIESAVCLAELVAIVDPIPKGLEYLTFVKYEAPTDEKRRVGLVFTNVMRIEPFPIKGKQGIGFLHWTDKEKIKFI